MRTPIINLPDWARTTKPALDGYRSTIEEAHQRSKLTDEREYARAELEPEPEGDY